MKKTMEIITAVLFCGFLFTMGILYFLLPEAEFSQKEKRNLEEKPAFTLETVLTGTWGEKTESYLADHMPGRDFFVGLNAYFDLLTGRQKAKNIWKDGDCLLEAPVSWDQKAAEKNLRSMEALQKRTELPMDLMIIPSAGVYHDFPQYRDEALIGKIYDMAPETMKTVDLRQVLSRDCFYRTDHHWTSDGAFRAYGAYGEQVGISVREDFQKESIPGFQGSTYSRSGLWLTEGEPVELWTGTENLQVDIGEENRTGVFWRENLQEPDKYTVFLGGNHPLVRIHNPEKEGKLLVIRDSFSNCLGPFLAESFGEVVLVDLRYYKQPISALCQQENFDRILVCYGLHNFMTDQNLVFLQR